MSAHLTSPTILRPDLLRYCLGRGFQCNGNRNLKCLQTAQVVFVTPPLTGFSEGSIYWDDENDNNQNAEPNNPRYNPAGTFNGNTNIEFCCRDDGASDQAIKVPIRRAFYLMRYKGPCQQVAEMTVTEEVVQWDDEDNVNFNKESGAYPLDTARDPTNHELHFCFYKPQTTGVQ
ncbi:uncharacterized protein [Littorina saxatilis]|uniref:uncharacterized protein n=1 Tax=Littorina saxatilis TaxID=31220 RepID=UPI0038B43C47